MPGFLAFISSFNLRVRRTLPAGGNTVNGFFRKKKKPTAADHE
jgi:hypothetical protein